MSVLARVADRLDGETEYRHDPVGWVTDKLGEHLWSKQRAIAESVRDHPLTAVHSAHDLGKSFIASRLAAWWLDSHPHNEAFVVSTAPTFPQVRAILWREIGRAHRKGDLPGRVNQTEWFIGDEIVGYGRKPADYDPAAFQGIHARYVLVIIDEACGVPKEIWDAVDSIATNADARILAIGNPDDPSSHFATVCKPGSGWNVIHLDGLESPNFTGEPVPADLSVMLLSKEWVEDKKARWGEGSSLYVAKVRGVFPEDAEDGVVPLSWVRRCQGKEANPQEGELVQLGVDVGAGGDFTSIREVRGRRAGRVWRDHSRDPQEVVGKIILAIHETGATVVKIDSIGIGWGIMGWLDDKRGQGVHNARVVGVNVGEVSTDPSRFPRLRDQIWWEIGRELSETGGWDLSELDDDTVAQLIAPKYGIDTSGRVKVERKIETRERLGRSPDDADALLLAYYSGGPVSPLQHTFWQWFDSIPAPEVTDLILTSWYARYEDSTRPLVVGQVWLRSRERCYLLEQVTGEMGLPELAKEMQALSAAWPEAGTKLFPHDGNGPQVISSLHQQVKGLVPWSSPEDEDGVQLVATMAGKVALRKEPWAQHLVSEASRFPQGVEGSMVRCMIQALSYLGAGTGQGEYRDARLAGRR